MTDPKDNPSKRCPKCDEAKPLDTFRRDRSTASGYRSYCRACCAADRRARYAADLERARDQSRRSVAKWRAANPEEARARRAAWQAANPEKATEWRRANPDKIKAYRRQFYIRHRESVLARNKRWRERAADTIREARRAYYLRNLDNIRAYRTANKSRAAARKRARYATDADFRRRAQESHARWARRFPEKVIDGNRRRQARLISAPEVERIDRSAIYERDRGICHICGKPVPRKAMTLDHLVPLSKGGPHTAKNLSVAHRSCNSKRGAGRLPAQLRLLG